jgi:hypothetical protein
MLRINKGVSIIFNYISAGVSEHDEDSLTEIGTGRDRQRESNHERMQHDTKLEDLSGIVSRRFLFVSGDLRTPTKIETTCLLRLSVLSSCSCASSPP